MRRAHLTGLAFSVLGLGLAACGSDGGSTPEPDGPGGPGADAAIDAPAADAPIDLPMAPPTITITGNAVTRTAAGAMPVAGATIAGYKNSDEATAIATTTTNAQGNFTLTVTTGGVALDGYLKATAPNLLDTYLYPPTPIAADTIAPINMVADGTRTFLFALAGVTRQPGTGLVALVVVDGATAQSMPIAGATVSSSPAAGAYRYNNPQTDLPGDAAITQTHTDGVAYMMNVPGNAVLSVSAAKPGSTFQSHNVKAWADRVTTTLITP